MTEQLDLFDEPDFRLLNAEKPKKKRAHRRTCEIADLTIEDEYRRCFGVQELVRLMGAERPLPGHSYHIISGGNIDLLSHLKWLLIHYKRFKRVFISCWVISSIDILLLKRWVESSEIGCVDIIVGDIFPGSYKQEWLLLRSLYDSGVVRRVYKSNIHSKFILMEPYDGEGVVVESSANCNMNPRIEQSVVTIDGGLFEFYDRYFEDLFKNEMYLDTNKQLVGMELTTEV